ncbi:MAG TPA: HEAT repeat domain-containing protein [Pyrinomonadaceae bacterium]|nr:HEAT repeat domain-containing protein [Pyrinomonadaceae bacterium]
MRRDFSLLTSFVTLTSFVFSLVLQATAQTPKSEPSAPDSSGWWYIGVAAITILGLAVAVFFWIKSKTSTAQPKFDYEARYRNNYNNGNYETESVDAAKEMEWLRKAKKGSSKAMPNPMRKNAVPNGKAPIGNNMGSPSELNFDTKIFQEKMRKLQYAQLPINGFDNLSPAKLYEPLPLSNDPALINAIEQANEEYEEDEAVRDLAVQILAAFRTRNSIETLAQIALYDLSSNLRSKAVSILTDFDHESVFETILLACADPTREVRAAAARGLFRLNFDRADAWKRIIETNDVFRMSHAVRAATEAGIVMKSFDRLIHDDLKVAYEAFALVRLVIYTGETEELFNAIRLHKDERVRYAILHVLKTHRDERTLSQLQTLQHDTSLPTDVSERVRETIASFAGVPA